MDNNNTSILLIIEQSEEELYIIYNKLKDTLTNINYFIINNTNNTNNLEQNILHLKTIYKYIYVLNLLQSTNNDNETIIYVNNFEKNCIFYNNFIRYLNLKLIYNGNDGIIKNKTINNNINNICKKYQNTKYYELQFNKNLFGLIHHPENINCYKKNRLYDALLLSFLNIINILSNNIIN
jgi:hypothetical protein